MLMDYSNFVLHKEKESEMTEFSQVSESCVEKIIGETKAITCQTDPIPPKFITMFQIYFTPVIYTLINLSQDKEIC